ncbi:MAG: YaaA family protein [Campylobacteraceae bacterium]|jgi:cytoplasmic iron level regulating protein YaaA (DUF328/UPF0246 family)|nr:YaaA family protein [Campylobacteraceae bacterium]
MLKILFSPSEDKSSHSPLKGKLRDALCFGGKFECRKECVELYNDILRGRNEKELSKLFGLKKRNEIEAFLPIGFEAESLQKAVLRYTGVAYSHLSYETLDEKAQGFIDTNVMIFSNLLGAVLAGEEIPYYKLKQGENLRGFDTSSHYKNAFKDEIDEWLAEAFVIDLRAGFYERFYTLQKPHITMRFYKNGKILSHFAKAYRGVVLRRLATQRPENINEFNQINFEGLHIIDIKHMKSRSEYSFEIKTLES